MTISAVDRAAGEPADQHADDAERRHDRIADDDVGGEAVGQHEDHADRKVDAGGDAPTSVCAIATNASSTPLLAAVLTTLDGRRLKPWPATWFEDVDREHHDEDAEREQRAALLGEPIAPVASRAPSAGTRVSLLAAPMPMLSALPISAALGDLGARRVRA